MARTLMLAGAALLLAACSPPATTSANTTQSASVSAPASPASPTNIQPGQYRTVVTIVSLSVPGMPAAQAQAMQAQPSSDESCVTSGDIGDFARTSLIDADEGEHCSDNHMTAANGHIDGAATCTNADGEAHTMQVTGSYSPTHVEMDATMSGQTPAGQMSQHVRMVTDRIGACPPQH